MIQTHLYSMCENLNQSITTHFSGRKKTLFIKDYESENKKSSSVMVG